MDWAPLARIIIRYVVGVIIGADAESVLEGNPQVVTLVAMAIGLVVEGLYAAAKRKGWAT
jgi:hypothetical protein